MAAATTAAGSPLTTVGNPNQPFNPLVLPVPTLGQLQGAATNQANQQINTQLGALPQASYLQGLGSALGHAQQSVVDTQNSLAASMPGLFGGALNAGSAGAQGSIRAAGGTVDPNLQAPGALLGALTLGSANALAGAAQAAPRLSEISLNNLANRQAAIKGTYGNLYNQFLQQGETQAGNQAVEQSNVRSAGAQAAFNRWLQTQNLGLNQQKTSSLASLQGAQGQAALQNANSAAMNALTNRANAESNAILRQSLAAYNTARIQGTDPKFVALHTFLPKLVESMNAKFITQHQWVAQPGTLSGGHTVTTMVYAFTPQQMLSQAVGVLQGAGYTPQEADSLARQALNQAQARSTTPRPGGLRLW